MSPRMQANGVAPVWVGRKRSRSSRIITSHKWFEDGEPKSQKTVQETARRLRPEDGYVLHPLKTHLIRGPKHEKEIST